VLMRPGQAAHSHCFAAMDTWGCALLCWASALSPHPETKIAGRPGARCGPAACMQANYVAPRLQRTQAREPEAPCRHAYVHMDGGLYTHLLPLHTFWA
jgi:hypothetical protein